MSNREWVGASLDADRVDPRGVAEFDEGEEGLAPRLNEVFGSC